MKITATCNGVEAHEVTRLVHINAAGDEAPACAEGKSTTQKRIPHTEYRAELRGENPENGDRIHLGVVTRDETVYVRGARYDVEITAAKE